MPQSEINPVRVFREEIGLTRIQLAQKLGTSYSHLNALELGYSTNLSLPLAKKLVDLGAPNEIRSLYGKWRNGE